jgi:hypothetical protein
MKKVFWAHKDANLPRPKSKGQGIMVSAFACACHGIFSWVQFEIGVNKGGWWTQERLIKQLEEEALTAFERLHPGKTGVFMFDNSGNHGKMPSDGLKTANLAVGNESLKGVDTMRNGCVLRDAEMADGTVKKVKIFHPMAFSDGTPWGLRTICEVRGLVKPGEKMLRAQLEELLDKEPDFMEQRSWMAEIITKRKHMCKSWPKFHCELQWIERMWGWLKRFVRERTDGKIETLRKNLKEAKEQLPKDLFMKWDRTAWRWIEAYNDPNHALMSFKQLEFTLRKYKTHRVASEGVYKMFDANS